MLLSPTITSEWSIARIAKEAPPTGWSEAFEEAYDALEIISKKVEESEAKFGISYPLREDIFAAFVYTPLERVKVVIIGQDPYYQTLHGGEPKAVGLSFSVRRHDVIPQSLQNIYKELERSIPGWTKPYHGDLVSWARQGVLLLNACLTVKPGTAGSHGGVWDSFMSVILNHINKERPGAIFLLWGGAAQSLKGMLTDTARILETSHPVARGNYNTFMGCDHFAEVNRILLEDGETPIDWTVY